MIDIESFKRFKRAVERGSTDGKPQYVHGKVAYSVGFATVNLVPGKAHSGLDFVNCEIVARKCPRLGEALVAQLAFEWANVNVTPVVNDQAGTLLKHLVATLVFAEEVSLHALFSWHQHLASFKAAGGHGLEASVGLLRRHILATRDHVGLWLD